VRKQSVSCRKNKANTLEQTYTAILFNVLIYKVCAFKRVNLNKNICDYYNDIKLMKGKALRKHSLHEKTAASVLLKLFISGNE